MRWPRAVRSITGECEEGAGPEDGEGLRCEACGKQVADKILSTAGVRPASTTCKGCSDASSVGSNPHRAGA